MRVSQRPPSVEAQAEQKISLRRRRWSIQPIWGGRSCHDRLPFEAPIRSQTGAPSHGCAQLCQCGAIHQVCQQASKATRKTKRSGSLMWVDWNPHERDFYQFTSFFLNKLAFVTIKKKRTPALSLCLSLSLSLYLNPWGNYREPSEGM